MIKLDVCEYCQDCLEFEKFMSVKFQEDKK